MMTSTSKKDDAGRSCVNSSCLVTPRRLQLSRQSMSRLVASSRRIDSTTTILIFLCWILAVACTTLGASITKTVSPSFSQSLTSSRTPTRSSSLSPFVTLSETRSPTRTLTATPTLSASVEVTLSDTSASPSVTWSITPPPTPTPSASGSLSASHSATRSTSSSITLVWTPTLTITPSRSFSATVSDSLTPSNTTSFTNVTPTPSIISTPSLSASHSTSWSHSSSLSNTTIPSASPTLLPTATPSPVSSPSLSLSPSGTNSSSPTISSTPSGTLSPSSSHTATPSTSVSPSSSLSQTPTYSVSPSASGTPEVSATPSSSTSESPVESQSSSETISQTPTYSPSLAISESFSSSKSASSSFSSSPEPSSSPSDSSSGSSSWSETESASLSSDPSASPSKSFSGSASSSTSVSSTGSGTSSSSQSVSTTVSDDPSISASPSISGTPSTSQSHSETYSLSPVWPERLSVTVSQAHPFYTVYGVPVFNFTGNQSLTIYPRLANGADMVPGFYRHPQPPFAITLEGPAAVVHTPFECSLSLPCTVTVWPSYDWWVPALLSVQYDNTFGPYEMDVEIVYKQGRTVGLQVFVEDPVTEELGPFPEIFVRGIDSDGFLTTFDKHVYVTVTIDNTIVATTGAVLTGKFTPPIQEGRAIRASSPTQGSEYTFLLNASTTQPESVTNITWGAMNVTIVKCPPPRPPVLTLIPADESTGQEAGGYINFSMPFTMLRNWVSVECLFGGLNTTVEANLTLTKCFASCYVPANATKVSLYIDHQANESKLMFLDLASGFKPELEFVNTHTGNLSRTTWEGRLDCFRAFLLNPSTMLGVSPRNFRMNVSDAFAIVNATDGVNITTSTVSTSFDIREEVDGYSICNLSLLGSNTYFFYNATIVMNLTVTGEYTNSSQFSVTALTTIHHQPDVVCRNRDALIKPPKSFLDDRRNISLARYLSQIPWRAEAAFIDNSTSYYNPTDPFMFYVLLSKSSPALPPTLGLTVDSTLMLLRTDFYLDIEKLPRQKILPPEVFSVEGCPDDVFPSALSCHSRGTTPITITGNNFNESHLMSFTFYDNPRFVPCEDTQFISPTKIVCHRYPGFGNNGSVVFHDAHPTEKVIYGISRGFITYAPNAAYRCPVGANGALCSGRGVCNALSGTCVCDANIYLGHWAGFDCSECAPSHNASTGCLLPCPADANGAVCSNRGHCIAGRCWCGFNWTYDACPMECPGADAPCSNRGTCDSLIGVCVCSGNFGGQDCNACADGWSGPSCTTTCPKNSDDGTACSGHGECISGGCLCDSGFCGTACETLTSSGTCGTCSLPGLYGASCTSLCPGASVASPCSGHGSCSNGVNGSGVCSCHSGYGLSDCSAICPTFSGIPCAGHGSCSYFNAQCMCDRFYGGTSCTQLCPSADGLVCAGHGMCSEGSSGTGECSCHLGYSGPACNITCLNEEWPCSGHGTCAGVGVCICFSDTTVGYWNDTSCSTCLYPWAGPECTGRCPSNSNDTSCSGHGTCSSTLKCSCTSERALGFWGGEDCSTCEVGYFGASCTSECPGGACLACTGHGTCDSGVGGSGQCTCYSNATVGLWSGAQCSQCAESYFGALCQSKCPTSTLGEVCPNGACNSGTTGTGECKCNLGFLLNKQGLCLECAAGYYGSRCQFCPSTTEQPCSGRGTCDDGFAGSGLCRCTVPYAGANCSYTCPVALGVVCGRGSCVAQEVCVCETGFQLTDGTCVNCKTGLWGPNCNKTCPNCAFGTCTRNGTCDCYSGYFGVLCDRQCPGGASSPCNHHGTCNATTGTCKCFNSTTQGFYLGATCSACDPRFESPQCTIRCPLSPSGVICSGRGTCYDGTCLNCAPLINETSTTLVQCGSACELTNYQCASPTCPYGTYGTDCSLLCPAADRSNLNGTTCNGNGICLNDGTCKCVFGFFGPACALSCPFVVGAGYCGGRGQCVEGTCVCTHGYYGSQCQSICPGGLTNICSNHGVCQYSSGVCTCSEGYYGAVCEHECPGGAATPCYLNGLCTSTGTCQCYYSSSEGYFGGSSCETCADLFVGASCTTPCPSSRGVVVNGACVCRTGYVGADCSKACLQDGLGIPCSGKGTCVEVSSIATCSCNAGYYGDLCDVVCTVQRCQEFGLYRAQCNGASGSCQCLDSAAGRWTGPLCDTCQDGYWGTECSLPCSCSNHGTCNQLTGACTCYATATQGYWSGTICGTCRTGYIGETCTFVNVEVPRLSREVNSNPFPSAAITAAPSVLDPDTHYFWVKDALVIAGIRVLVSGIDGSFTSIGSMLLPTAPSWIDIYDTAHIRVVLVSGTVMYFEREVSNGVLVVASSSEFRMARRRADILAAPTGIASGVTFSLRGVLCEVYIIDLTLTDAILYCGETDETFILKDTTLVMSSVVWIGTTLDDSRIVVAGSAKTDGNWAWATYNATTLALIARGSNVATAARGSPKKCYARNAEVVVCILRDPVREAIYQVIFNSTLSIDSLMGYVTMGSAAIDIQVTAIMRADAFDTILVALSPVMNSGATSTVYMIQLSTGDLVNSIAMDDGSMVTAGHIDEAQRLALFIVVSDFAISFSSYSLFGVKGVSPTVVDENGGAIITVQGVGFTTGNDTVVLCNVSGSLIRATVSSTSLLQCVTEKVVVATTSCDIDSINLIFVNASSRTTFNTLVGIYRPSSATLVSATSAVGNEGFGAYDSSVAVSISGFGFVETPKASCRFVRLSDNHVFFVSPVQKYINSSMVVCMQYPTDPSSEPTGFQYSHDGTYYSTETHALYMIVGPTSQVNATTANLTIVAAAVSAVPAVSVYLVDSFGNQRLSLETSVFKIRISSLDPIVQIAGNAEAVTFVNGSTMVLETSEGVATFSNVQIQTPIAGALTLNFFSTEDISLATSIVFTVVAGTPAALQVSKSASWRTGVFSIIRLTPAPVVKVIDAAGNIVSSSEAFARVIYTSARENADGTIDMATTTQFAAADDDGFYTFSTISMKTVFDTDAFMVFSVGDVPELRVLVPQETCIDKIEYAEVGKFTCALCPPNSVCDGTTNVVVNPGYWRSAADSFEFYECTPPEACPGGTGCADGYASTMCSACDAGYGKNQGSCSTCLSTPINWVLTIIVLLAFVAIVYFLSIGGMTVTCLRDAELTKIEKVQHNPLSVVVKVAVSYLQMLTLIPFTKLNMPSWMSSFMAGSSSGSKFNPNLSFVGCLFAANEAQTFTVVLLIIPIAMFACVVLSIVFAYLRTYRGINLNAAMAELNLIAAAKGEATTRSLREDLAKTIAGDNRKHYRYIIETHTELFGDATHSIKDAEEEKKAEIKQRKIDLKQRLLNMFLVSVLVALFFLYPTIIEYCANMLSCQTVDMGYSLPSKSVLTKDPSVDCASSEYKNAFLAACGSLAGLGVGIPLLNYAFVQTLRYFTCDGELELAKTIFFFTTGGYREKVWYWETISLLRKMLVVLVMTIPADDEMKLLGGLWVLMISVLVNISHQPWSERILHLTETTTLAAIAATYGLLELTFYPTIADSDMNLLLVYLAVALVNVMALGSLVIAVMWSTHKTIVNLASKRGPIGYFFAQLQAGMDGSSVSIRSLNNNVKKIHEKMEQRFPREYSVALVELAVAQIISEHDEKMEAQTNVLNPFKMLGSPAGNPRRGSRAPRLPPAASFMTAVSALASMPRLLRDSGGPSRSVTTMRTSSRESSKKSSMGSQPNPLTPPSLSVVAGTKEESSVFGPRVTFTDVPSPTMLPVTDVVTFSEASVREQLPEATAHLGVSLRSTSVRNPMGPSSSSTATAMSNSRPRRSGSSWIDNANPQVANREDIIDDIVADVEQRLAVLKRAEGYTAMRLREILNMGELGYASTLIEEVYDAEEQFFRAAAELRDSASNVSQVVTL